MKNNQQEIRMTPYSLSEFIRILNSYANYNIIEDSYEYSEVYLKNAICTTLERSFIGKKLADIEEVFDGIFTDNQFAELVYTYCNYPELVVKAHKEGSNMKEERQFYFKNLLLVVKKQFSLE